jgi:hypothetical protein
VGPQANLTLLADLSLHGDHASTPEEAPRTASAPQSVPESFSDDHPWPPAFAPIHQRSKPEKRDILNAFHQGSMDVAREMADSELIRPDSVIAVVERVEVKQLKIKHDEGSIRLKLTEALALDHGKVKPGAVVERDFSLDRREGVWVISDPDQRIYILREQAEQVFEKQLQLMLQTDGANGSKRALIKALNLLYEREIATSGTTEARKH